MDPSLKTGLLIALGLLAVIAIMVLLARWARGGSKGAVISGALLSMFAAGTGSILFAMDDTALRIGTGILIGIGCMVVLSIKTCSDCEEAP